MKSTVNVSVIAQRIHLVLRLQTLIEKIVQRIKGDEDDAAEARVRIVALETDMQEQAKPRIVALETNAQEAQNRIIAIEAEIQSLRQRVAALEAIVG